MSAAAKDKEKKKNKNKDGTEARKEVTITSNDANRTVISSAELWGFAGPLFVIYNDSRTRLQSGPLLFCVRVGQILLDLGDHLDGVVLNLGYTEFQGVPLFVRNVVLERPKEVSPQWRKKKTKKNTINLVDVQELPEVVRLLLGRLLRVLENVDKVFHSFIKEV